MTQAVAFVHLLSGRLPVHTHTHTHTCTHTHVHAHTPGQTSSTGPALRLCWPGLSRHCSFCPRLSFPACELSGPAGLRPLLGWVHRGASGQGVGVGSGKRPPTFSRPPGPFQPVDSASPPSGSPLPATHPALPRSAGEDTPSSQSLESRVILPRRPPPSSDPLPRGSSSFRGPGECSARPGWDVWVPCVRPHWAPWVLTWHLEGSGWILRPDRGAVFFMTCSPSALPTGVSSSRTPWQS